MPPKSDPSVIPLWEGKPPHGQGDQERDIPSLTSVLPEKGPHPSPAVIVCPGGGYLGLATVHEGIAICEWFRERGIAGFMLRYRLPGLCEAYRHPVPLLDVQRAIRLVRSRAAEWNLDPQRVAIMGLSAGGHVASTAATHFDSGDSTDPDPVNHQSSRPDFAVLAYPLISLKNGLTHIDSRARLLGPDPDPALIESLSNETQVTPQTPPTLLIHASDDRDVSIEHSRLMLAALRKAGVPAALHEYPAGGHGFGYGPNNYNNNGPVGWIESAYTWLKEEGFAA